MDLSLQIGKEYEWTLTRGRKDGVLVPKDNATEEYIGMPVIQSSVITIIDSLDWWAVGLQVQLCKKRYDGLGNRRVKELGKKLI